MSLIEIEGVSFAYASHPDVPALRDVTCSIERGAFIGVTGVSGAGKSTFCRLIAGYIPNFFDGTLSGTVTVDGISTAESSIGELSSKVGFVFENPFDQLTGASLTVTEEVAFALENMGLEREEIRRRVRTSLGQAGIRELAERHPRKLSGGQSQRVALASVLAIRPGILVLDEPTSQLDPLGTEEVLETIADMHRDGYTVVIASQDLDRLAMHMDRLLIIDGGTIVWDGPPRDVLVKAATSRHPLLIPDVVEVGLRLRDSGLVQADKPIPLTVHEAAEELAPVLGDAPAYGQEEAEDSSRLANSSGTAIVLDDVHYTYPGDVHALRGISLTLTQGCVCVVGQNGAGKTTLLKHLNGLLRPTAGRVVINGQDSREHRVAEIARSVGLVFQNPDDQLFRTSVREEVSFGAVNLGYPRETVEGLTERALSRLGLEEVTDNKPYDLGLSWRKRVAVASVVAMNTPALILDEPTAGQDAPGIELLGRLVDDLANEGRLVVVVTHDVEFARAHAQRIVALYQGEILLDGHPREVFRDEQTLARTYVRPPVVTRLGMALGLARTTLSIGELFAAIERDQRDEGRCLPCKER